MLKLAARLLAPVVLTLAASRGFTQDERVPPEKAHETFRIADGLEVSLFAAEPLVRQPVSITFDDRGRMWVLQYIQYPIPKDLNAVAVDQYLRTKYDKVPDPPPKGPKGEDRITILEDSDGDGRVDKGTDFIADLNLASGMAIGHGGVFVAQPPYLLFYPDQNGDDVPDGDPEVLLTGFGMEDAHAFANSLTWGPDGWLYGAQGSTVTANIRGIEFQQGVWRYHPKSREFELFAEGGGNSWGIDFDPYGNLFAFGNTLEPLVHHVQGAYYVKGFGKHGPLHNPFSFGYFQPAKHHGYLGDSLTGGAVVYQGGTFPERFTNECIAPNTRHNASRWNRIERVGSTFETHFAADFLTSTDKAHRPVDMFVGPDGAVYVADWYDVNISHSSPKNRAEWYMPSTGDGRIWRLQAKDAKPKVILDRPLDELSGDELIDLFEHPNVWYTREALRILAERSNADVVPRLERILSETDSEPLALRALWGAYLSGGFNEGLALRAMQHRFEYVRAWTVRLLGDAKQVSPNVAERFVELAKSDDSVIVRAQLACTAKRLPGSDGLPIVAELLKRKDDVSDAFMPLLLWWAIEDKAESDRERVLAMVESPDAWKLPLVRDTVVERLARRYMGEGDAEGYATCARLLALAPGDAEKAILVGGLEQQLAGRSLQNPPQVLVEAVAELLEHPQPSVTLVRLTMRLRIFGGIQMALQRIHDANVSDEDRLSLISALGEVDEPACVPGLLLLLSSGASDAVQQATLAAVERYDDPTIATTVLEAYPRLASTPRTRVISLLCGRAAWAVALLDAVDAGTIDPKAVSLDQLRQIVLHGDPALEQRMAKHWGSIKPATAREKEGRIRSVTEILRKGPGNPEHGKQQFKKHCATCHKLFGEGESIGPDLTGAERRNLDQLLLNVIDPSAAIRPQYQAHIVVTTRGQVLTGLIADSTAETVTLLDAKNQRSVIERSDIEVLEPADTSLMPEKLLDALQDEEIRDLFQYVQSEGTGVSP